MSYNVILQYVTFCVKFCGFFFFFSIMQITLKHGVTYITNLTIFIIE